MTKLRKKLTEKTRKFGAEVRRRHSTGLTPESENTTSTSRLPFLRTGTTITGQDVMDLN